MRPVGGFLADLRSRNIKVWLEAGDRLRYSAPAGAMTDDLLNELKQRKGEILTFIRDATEAMSAPTEPIQPVIRDGRLSFAQERLWFLDQLEPGNPFYNVAIALRLHGTLDTTALERSLGELVRRHESLRTTFPARNGQASQQIAPAAEAGTPWPLPRVDLSSYPDPQAELHRLAIEEARLPFDLAYGPLLRTTLLHLGPEEQALFVTMHHIVSDGWSMGVLVREMAALYGAFVRGEPSPLPPLPLHYADFATWQRQHLTGSLLEQQLGYWVDHLRDAPPVIALPTDRPRPAVQSFRGDSERFEIGAELAQRLRALSQQQGATLFMTLQAAFAVLLARYSQQRDLVIGTPIANRTRPELEALIGFFVNTLPMRVDLSGNPSFLALLQRVREGAIHAFANQDLPFEKLVDVLQPERDLSRNPLFQVMFALQNAPTEALELPGLTLNLLETHRVAALFDLVLDMWETPTGLVGVLEYNSDLFDAPTVQRLVRHFVALLDAVATDPTCPVEEIPLLSASERAQLLDEWAGPRRDFPVETPLPLLFEQQVARGPERVALVCAGERLSYDKLNRRANQIAHLLRHLGVQRNDFVGILIERGGDFLAAMLGVLKAGAAYLPIDPAYPPERVRYMIGDSAIQTLITREALLGPDTLPTAEALRHLLCLDEAGHGPTHAALAEGPRTALHRHTWADLAQQPTTNPPPVNEGRDRAYMLYTSGSTGQPKGAIIRHNGAVNHIFAEYELLAFHPDSAFLQSAPASSDISVWQFLAPVLIGGRTVVADMETVANPAKLFQLLHAEGITLIELVPVVMKALLDYVAQLPPAARALPALEWAMVTGEAVSVALVNQWLATYPTVKLVNAYGPTEAADDICQAVIATPLPDDCHNVPIGKPVANLTLYVLDAAQRLVPIGVPGEIAVAGIGVGEGYWRNPEKTTAAFLPNPYATHEHDSVLYRTGDLGRWLPDGSLEYLERLDQQVKLRGFRIELGEIEDALASHPAVALSAVALRPDATGEKHLVAYIVPSQGGAEFDALRTEQLSLWQELHEQSYQVVAGDDPTFNTIGWDSSYTNQPLSVAEMQEYIGGTVERVLALRPRRLLEIGCGTGLIAFRLLPHCAQYLGVDLSTVAIAQLQAAQHRPDLQARVPGLADATFAARAAHTFEPSELRGFDTAIFPSVVQYFPGIDYLLHVLTALVRGLEPGGAIFLGDVRSLPLLEAFHASVQAYRATPDVTAAALRQRVAQQLAQEQELAIDPAFFLALREHLPEIGHVRILPKRGQHQNEMSRFRYDVVLHLGTLPIAAPAVEWLDWRRQPLTLAEIAQHLHAQQPSTFGLRHVANARVQAERHLLHWLASAPAEEPLSAVDAQRTTAQPRDGLEAEALWGLNLPYQVDITLAQGGQEGELDVLFRRTEDGSPLPMPAISMAEPARPWSHYANNPLREKLARTLIPRLRERVQARLPGHMVPSSLLLLDRMPTTPNGKIDRDALPAPTAAGRTAAQGYQPPRNPTEATLCAICADVLGLERVGVLDNFFEMGGHSLKATQVMSRIHRDLGVELPLRTLFSHPTVALLATQVAAQGASSGAEIHRQPDAPDYPLSHAQHRLWILAQMAESSAAYHIPGALLLEGEVDAALFQQVLDMLVQRHEALRTTFHLVQGTPRQRVHEWRSLPLTRYDLRGATEPDAEARRLAGADARQPFDLENGPLLRAALLTLAPTRHVLLVTLHHLISDAWSEMVLVREFVQLYEALRAGNPSPLPPLRLHYRDFAVWQNEFLASEAIAPARAYWHEKLGGELPVLELPSDFPRPPVKQYAGATHSLLLDAAQSAGLLALGHREQASLFMVLVAAVKALLYRYTGQRDLIVGSPIAGRTHADLEEQIGFYINMLALRDEVAGDLPFTDLLARVRQSATEAYEHQHYPFDRLVNELNVSRDPSRHPLFDVAVVLQNITPAPFELLGVAIRPFSQSYEVSKFDLQWTFEAQGECLRLDITYSRDLFLPERIARMAAHFQELVAGFITDPAMRVGELPLLPATEREQVLAFNRATPAAPVTETLVSRFAQQVARTPDTVAVSYEGESLSYAALDARANQLAHHLQTLGVGPETLVGLCLERSLDLVVGLLGILKAGGAYLPLDPTYPAERLAFMVADAEVPVVVTQQRLWQPLFPNGDPARHIVCLDEDEAMLAQAPIHDPTEGAQPEDLAYVIYTSGSTGRPKGVQVSHANVVRLFDSTEAWFGFNERDVWTLFHSYAFDFSVWELWGALLYGGRLVVVPYLVSRAPELFRALLAQEGVTVLNQTPSAFRQLMEADQRAPTPLSLRTVIFGGEALEVQSLRPWFERHGDERPCLVNMYGITETTVHVTYRPLGWEDLNHPASVIGQAIPDLSLYILDEQLRPLPIGITGEMYVGGAGVARGYLNRPDLTRERFLPDPFRADSAARLYKTGDLARYLPNGDIEYLGRRDQQVKIRGFRIELGEIEAALVSHPTVREAAVIPRDGAAGKELVAYIVPTHGEGLSLTDLRRTLRAHLPEYMVPAAVVTLDRLPLTGNGKLDRRALPDPTPAAGDATVPSAAPQSALEQTLAEIWQSVLQVERVGVLDNFFDIGGNSLSLVRVHTALRERVDEAVDVVDLFQYPTIQALAHHLGQRRAAGNETPPTVDAATSRAARQKEARLAAPRGRARPEEQKP